MTSISSTSLASVPLRIAGSVQQSPSPAPEVKDWTVLVYNAGYRDEGKMCTASLLDLERVGSDDRTHVVAMNYRTPWVAEHLGFNKEFLGARTYYVTRHDAPPSELPDFVSRRLPEDATNFVRFLESSPRQIQSPVIQEHPADVNMGEAATLRQFLLENVQKYPARHYAVVISGHGAAWGGQSIVHHPEGRIHNEDLGRVLAEVSQQIGHKIDLVNLNTCFSANVETLFPLRQGADVVVASEGTVFGGTQPFGKVLSDLQQGLREGRDLSGQDLGRLFVEETRRQPLSNLYTGTLSAVDLTRLEALTGALTGLQQTLIDEKVPPDTIRKAYIDSLRIDYSSVPRQVYVTDIGSFADHIVAACDSEKVRKSAAAVQAAMKDCVFAEEHANHALETITGQAVCTLLRMPEASPGLTGLTMYLDDHANDPDSRLDQIQKTDYARAGNAEAFLRYASLPADEDAGPLHRIAAWHTQQVQNLDRKLGVPFAVSVGERVALGAGMLAAFHGMHAVGIPAYPLIFGTYFTVRGTCNALTGARDALKAEKATPSQQEALIGQVSKAAVGALMATFGLYVWGVLPHVVAWPAAIAAVTIRGAAEAAKIWVHRHEAAAARDEARKFEQMSTTDKLKLTTR